MGKNNYPFSIDGECRIVPKDPLYSTLQKIEMTGIITLNNNEKYTMK